LNQLATVDNNNILLHGFSAILLFLLFTKQSIGSIEKKTTKNEKVMISRDVIAAVFTSHYSGLALEREINLARWLQSAFRPVDELVNIPVVISTIGGTAFVDPGDRNAR
jgi:hypothetical protein